MWNHVADLDLDGDSDNQFTGANANYTGWVDCHGDPELIDDTADPTTTWGAVNWKQDSIDNPDATQDGIECTNAGSLEFNRATVYDVSKFYWHRRCYRGSFSRTGFGSVRRYVSAVVGDDGQHGGGRRSVGWFRLPNPPDR